MKPKTIEEYAEIYRCPATNENEYCRHDIISAINFGIELQKKISYNKDELIEILNEHSDYLDGFIYQYIDKNDIEENEEWFEQFKK